MHAATLRDFEIPPRHGLRQTIGDTLGIGGIFRALRTIPVLQGIAADMAELCPDAWLLNYTNPMAMRAGRSTRARRSAASSACATRSEHHALARRARRRAVRARSRSSPPASTTRPGSCASSATARDLYPRLDEAIEADPELRRRVRVEHVPPASATSRPSPASTPPSTCRGSCATTREVERLRIPVGEYMRAQRGEPRASTPRPGARWRPASRCALEPSLEYAPQIMHAIETGTPRDDLRQRAQRRADRQPAGGRLRRGAVPGRRGRRAADRTSARCRRSARRSTARFLNVCELTVRAALDGRPRPRLPRRDARPEHRRHADARRRSRRCATS